MAGPSIYEPKSGFERWLDARLPIIRFTQEHLLSYPTPRNLNVWWTFGGILTFFLVLQTYIYAGWISSGEATRTPAAARIITKRSIRKA